ESPSAASSRRARRATRAARAARRSAIASCGRESDVRSRRDTRTVGANPVAESKRARGLGFASLAPRPCLGRFRAMSYDTLTYAVDDRVATITVNRPDK